MADPKDKSKDKSKAKKQPLRTYEDPVNVQPLRTYEDPVNVETYTTGGEAYKITVEDGSNYAREGTKGNLRPVGTFNKKQDDPMWQGYNAPSKKINLAKFKMKS